MQLLKTLLKSVNKSATKSSEIAKRLASHIYTEIFYFKNAQNISYMIYFVTFGHLLCTGSAARKVVIVTKPIMVVKIPYK